MDLKSGHGTFLNGERVAALTPTRLKENDVVTFGASTRRFTLKFIESTKKSKQDGEQQPLAKAEAKAEHPPKLEKPKAVRV